MPATPSPERRERRWLGGKKERELAARYRARAAQERYKGREDSFDTARILAAANFTVDA